MVLHSKWIAIAIVCLLLALHDGEGTKYDIAKNHWTVVDPECKVEAKRIAEENCIYYDKV